MKSVDAFLKKTEASRQGKLKQAVIVGGDSEAVLESLSAAKDWVRASIVGDSTAIKTRIESMGVALGEHEIIHADSEEDTAMKAVELCRSADVVVKGQIHTDVFMRSMLSSASGLRGDKICSHVFYMLSDDFPHGYFISDGALNFKPTGKVGEAILQNLAELMAKVENVPPKIAILSATEVIHPKIESSLEADRLLQWAMANLPKEWAENIVAPIALDGAVNPKAAEIKGLTHKTAGFANGLLVPSIEAGNILFKSWVHFNNAIAAGVIVGARLPIVLTSRSDSAESRLASLALALL